MSEFPSCDVTFDDGTSLAAFQISRFDDRLTLQIVQMQPALIIKRGMAVTITDDHGARRGAVTWAPTFTLSTTVLIVKVEPGEAGHLP